ncbi:MAG: hypothetical protein M1821_006552 [Bathelium mastoideum]|nr:MAG: hypothetical protein M1821_006552 [Bathelium mastoideum]
MIPYDFQKLSPLDDGDVRLLKLHCAPWDADLEGNLLQRSLLQHKGPRTKLLGGQQVEILSPEPYDALSYHWDDDWPSEQEAKYIKILVQSEVYAIRIRPNLFYALRQLRSLSEEPLYLWVDALCINQEDGNEKSQQIQRMYLIYNKAEQIRIWLGLESHNSSKAIRFVEKCLKLDDFDRLVQDTPTSEHWAALSTLMRRRWFNRRWIIQEISLARNATLHCGKDSLPWRDFADCVSLFYHKRQDLKRLFRESSRFHNHPDYLGDLTELGAVRLVYASDNLFRKSKDGHITERLLSLEALMSSLTAFEASDPHDVVYAVLWLAKDARPLAVTEKKSPEPSADETESSMPIDFKPASPEEQVSQQTISKVSHTGHDDAPRRKSESLSHPQKSSEQMEAIVKDTEDIGTRKRDMRKQLLREVAKLKMADSESNRNWNHPEQAKTPQTPTMEVNRTRSLSLKDKELLRKTQVVSRLMRLSKHNRIVVDYKRSIFDVCKEFLKFAIDRSRSLDILCRPWAPRDASLPSWIPRLDNNPFGISQHGVHRRVNADPLVGRPGFETSTYKASYTSTAQVRNLHITGRSFIAKGFVLDRIKAKKATATAGIIPYEWIAAGGWNDTSQLPPELFWRTLVGDRDQHSQKPPSHWRRVCREAFQRRPDRGDLNTGEAVMYDCPSAVREYLERVQCIVWSRRLILLEELEDSLGIAPREASKGDEICILYGCSVPVVLRKYINGVPARKVNSSGVKIDTLVNQNKPDVYYEFIGECYIHGMMDGEAFGVRKGDKAHQQEFELR